MRAFMLFAWTVLAIATGYTLFHITFEVEALESELAHLNRQIVREQEAIHVLEAEWAFLNRPARIERLSETLLPMLHRVEPRQVLRLDALPFRETEEEEEKLPSVGAARQRASDAVPASLVTSEEGDAR